mmetsp:Transcript_11471/g.33010  ORF Transcript_11471/g.33010 Transcript_11471/m.33010 type:complete len:143 (+) Transcript_11471:483-911(+)
MEDPQLPNALRWTDANPIRLMLWLEFRLPTESREEDPSSWEWDRRWLRLGDRGLEIWRSSCCPDPLPEVCFVWNATDSNNNSHSNSNSHSHSNSHSNNTSGRSERVCPPYPDRSILCHVASVSCDVAALYPGLEVIARDEFW